MAAVIASAGVISEDNVPRSVELHHQLGHEKEDKLQQTNLRLHDSSSDESPSSTRERFGSLESGTSTNITSFGSSTSPDDRDHIRLTPSKKRTADGNIKTSSPIKTIPGPQSNTSHTTSKQKIIYHNLNIPDYTSNFRPRSSIPTSLPASEFAKQCIEAALSSRLDPYALHHNEHSYLVDHITSTEVTIYLNIRNAILRLWLRNPLSSVTLEEAAGCAKESRFFGLAEFAWRWLVRYGYINFGCIEAPPDIRNIPREKSLQDPPTIVVVGAGVSGLTTARQLQNLFLHDQEYWLHRYKRLPKVIIVEGRKRVGGRVYSKPLRTQDKQRLPGHYRNTAEMGAMIVTGFERGNPLDILIRAQLGIPYHLLRDALTIYDTDGKPVDEQRDLLNTDLYTDISDRTGEFRIVPDQRYTMKGDEDLINRARDPTKSDLAALEMESIPEAFDPLGQRKPISKRGRRTNAPLGNEKITVRSETGNAPLRAARAAHQMGWQVKEGVSKQQSVSLRAIAKAHHHPSLGTVMDAAIKQYQSFLNFHPQDMRLLNWHHANLEYANAAPVTRLSLSGHDQDNGNEFEGAHSEIVGGYSQLPRGLLNLPTKLDVRFDQVVHGIYYDPEANGQRETGILCTNGQYLKADQLVVTLPLGVLKHNPLYIQPDLPDWKKGAIDRMGFGLLNKVILVYDAPFWDESRDMLGLLNDPEELDSLDPRHYEARRGRFYLIWNATKISGRPMLVALMAGHAAQQAEATDTASLLYEITERLTKIFDRDVPAPREVIVTRWRQDPFARGTYSYVAEKTLPGDYNIMAQSIGTLHFAGEATCGTHPATVHGAFLSGLRAAADVVEALIGPIQLPSPLIGTASAKESVKAVKLKPVASAPQHIQIKVEPETNDITAIPLIPAVQPSGPPSRSVCSSDPSFWVSASFDDNADLREAMITSVIFAQIGERPVKPARSGVNPFLLYSRAKWDICKAGIAIEGSTSSGRNAIRQTLGQWWKALSDEEKQPYVDQSRTAQESAEAEKKIWTAASAQWDADAKRIKAEYERDHPRQSSAAWEEKSGRRKTNVSTNIALDFTHS